MSDAEKDANRSYREGSRAAAELESYFLYEQYKQIKFVFDKRQHETCVDLQAAGYPVPVPKRLYIDLMLNNLSGSALSSAVFADNWGYNCTNEIDQALFPDLYSLRESAGLTEYDPYSFLRKELSRCAIWCAIMSAVALMDDRDQFIFCNFLQDLIHRKELPNSYIVIFQIIWEEIQAVKAKGEHQRKAWKSLNRCYDCYTDFLKFIEVEPLEEHFQIETYQYSAHELDSRLETITFSVDTTDEWFMEFIQKYRHVCNPHYFLDFRWNLSSGENSLLSLFASLYYIYEADYTNPKNGEYQIWNLSEQGRRTQCDSVILLLDEADLTYHPEWQRVFIDLLTAFLPKLYPPMCCQDIQIILTTHSPVLLSDIPQQSVIYLKYDPETRRTRVDSPAQEGTFGQNIHLLYKSSFFLENGTIGRFAQRKIKSLVEELHDIEEKLEEFSPGYISEKLEYQLRPCAELIAEPIIRRRVLTWIDVLEKKLSSEKRDSRFRNMSDNELEQELDRLREELRRRKHLRILSYKEPPQGKAIMDRYLYMAAYVLPFSPEDVLGEDELEVDGKTYNAKNFIQESGKRPRNRNKNYRQLLTTYRIPMSGTPPLSNAEQDQLLAAKLIWSASQKLYAYLYQTSNPQIELIGLLPVRRSNLRRLLVSKMDRLEPALKKVGSINNKQQSKLLLNEVFRYNSFASIAASPKDSHVEKLLDTMGVNVCPYCNRLYTVTLVGKDGKSRAQLDHYKNKDQYPYFAVSLMNLIPSCGLCNQGKGKNDVTVLYPYSDEMELDAVFRTKSETGVSYLTGNRNAADEFSVFLDIAEDLPKELVERIEQSDKFFHLTELYNRHKEYILYLFWNNYVFSHEYLEELCRQFPEAFHSFEDAKSMMYLMDIDQAQWGKRSLGKLTHDIDAEINT